MLTIYGIANCDTVRAARAWLKERNIAHRFHDYRKEGLSAEKFDAFMTALGWEVLLNKRGTTWRQLDDEDKSGLDPARAAALMLAHVALIKRPVWEKDGDYRLGFAAKDRDALAGWLNTAE
ncbi:ArsC family reductase [Eilatimonas milleporae]|uniref:Spx/MgsR family transcriptional regulator n=1 Tax=Eilatimonas milleporae TaxID=911205 RepID=A0A3M0C4G9_9PROT|nr:ArsC family reductase [Eilatimonas milleporae]RMB04618.1 Spx/MgsR family transcriptional regulator [Eilatimonas milleporae]